MSTGSAETPFSPGADAPVAEPTLEDVQRRERRMIVALVALLAGLALIGWLAIPSDEALLEQATYSPSNTERIEAMNALVHRGYWGKRPPVELRICVSQQPMEVRRFMQKEHHRLMAR